MPERFADRIRHYCEAHGIHIPIGFGKRTPSRYAIVIMTEPPKLIARTWFKQEDVVYYLKNINQEPMFRILDFKEYVELIHDNSDQLCRGGSIL